MVTLESVEAGSEVPEILVCVHATVNDGRNMRAYGSLSRFHVDFATTFSGWFHRAISKSSLNMCLGANNIWIFLLFI